MDSQKTYQPGYPQMAAYPPYPSAGDQPYPQSGYPAYPPYQQGPPPPGFTNYPQQPYIPPPVNQPYIPPSSNQPYIPPTTTHISPETYDEQKDDLPGWQGFSEKSIRRLFIRKVYLILMLQLIFTFGVVALFTFSTKVKKFTKRNPVVYIVAYVTFLVLYLILACCQSLRRKWPHNMIFLALFTIAFSYVCGTIAGQYSTYSVIMCFGICASCCLVITLFSFNTKYDLTSWLGILVIISWCLFLFGIICIVTIRSEAFPIMHKVYAGIAAVLFMLFLAVDTQMLMGGKKYSLSPEEHIFAALQLYMDIMYIFLMLLTLFGKRD